MFGLNQAVLAEGLTMARAAGIDDKTFAETIADASGASYALDRFVLPSEYNSEFTLSLMKKDVKLTEQFAAANDVSLLVGGASSVYRLGEMLGHKDIDSAAILKLYEAIAPQTSE